MNAQEIGVNVEAFKPGVFRAVSVLDVLVPVTEMLNVVAVPSLTARATVNCTSG